MRHTVPTGFVAAAAVSVIAVSAAVALPEVVAGSGELKATQRTDALGSLDRYAIVLYPSMPTAQGWATPDPMATPTVTPTPKPAATPKPKAPYRDTVANAKSYARSKLGATQYACLDKIFYYESKWNPLATNSKSGAYGIPQALPGSKMATFGSNWRTSPLTQVKWGIWYVNDRYGSACAAWDHILSVGWY